MAKLHAESFQNLYADIFLESGCLKSDGQFCKSLSNW